MDSSETAAATAAATAGEEDGGAKINEVWHVRHGERSDEVSGAERLAWQQSSRYKNGGWFDPFLTGHGHVQASRAGVYLKSLSFTQRQPGRFDIVYTSPLVRAVQTAVCVSQALGNLPLQVVPGLASCTAALARIGYASAESTLMTDADIAGTFPWVTVVPRDPLAPTSFSEAAAWLAGKAREKEGAADSSGGGGVGEGEGEGEGGGSRLVSRVLAVGHREGTKAMAGRRVPTPHCCIGVFRVEPAASGRRYTYELHDLLSHKGRSLKPKGEESIYARPPTTAAAAESQGRRSGSSGSSGSSSGSSGNGDVAGDGVVEALAERVIALTVRTGSSKPRGGENSRHENTGARATGTGSARSSSSSSRQGGGRAAALARSIRGASPSLWPTEARKGSHTRAKSASDTHAVGKVETRGPSAAMTRKSLRRASSEEKGKGRKAESASGGAVASRNGAGQAESPPPRTNKDDAAAAAKETAGVVSAPAPGDVKAPGLAAPRSGACAGGGFQVVRLSRRRSVGGGSTFAGLLGVPVDTLCGESGVLSFLSPTELCAVRAGGQL